MANSERAGKLTYERLGNSLRRLEEAISTQFPELKDAQRARDLQRAIKDTLNAVRAGTSGGVVSPAELKRDLKTRIAEIHAQHDALPSVEMSGSVNTLASSSANSNTSQPAAAKRTRRSIESGKENSTPAPSSAPASAQPIPPCTVSAVKKRPLPKRCTITSTKNLNDNTHPAAAAPKRPSRTRTSSKTTFQAPVTPLQTIAAEEADRRAAAAALLGLADGSPETSFTSFTSSFPSSGSGSNWSAGLSREGKKRGRGAFEDGIGDADTHGAADGSKANTVVQPREHTSPPSKRRKPSFAPVPSMQECVGVQSAFEMGVRYAAAQLSVHGVHSTAAAELGEWVKTEFERRDAALTAAQRSADWQLGGGANGVARVGGLEGASVASGGGESARKGFWDVI